MKDFFSSLTTKKAIIIIVVLGVVVFFNGLFNNFVDDDIPQIVENPFTHSVSNIPIFFTSGSFYFPEVQKLLSVYYKPLLMSVFSFLYTFLGPSAFPFHLFQTLLHVVNTFILFLFFKSFFKKPLALILSLIFLVHPINSEVVFYVSSTQESLFFFFGILALWLLSKAQSKKNLILASLSVFLSTISKETGALFLVVSAMYVLVFNKNKKHFYILSSFLVIAFVIYLLLRINAVGLFTNPANIPISNLSLPERLLNVPAIFLFYLKTFTFPLNLAHLYQWAYEEVSFNYFFLPLFIDLLVITVMVYGAIFLFRNYHKKYFDIYIFFTIWFLVGVLLHLQLLPLDATVAERWFYFPIVGLLGMIGVFLEAIHFNFSNKRNLSLVILVLALLSFRTFVRSYDWRDELRLNMHDIRVAPESYALENSISFELTKLERFQEARAHAERSIEIYPTYLGYNNLGLSYLGEGNYQKAKEAFLKALSFGDYPLTYENLAGLYLVSGDSESSNFIQIALEKFPRDARLWLYLSVSEYKAGHIDEAKNAISKAYALDQDQEISLIYIDIMNNRPLQIEFSIGK